MPVYKTIVLELLQDRSALHEQLRAGGTLLQSMEQMAIALRAFHLEWMAKLAATRPGSDPSQLSSEALELAVNELQDDLPIDSSASEEAMQPLSLDAAMAFLQRHMPAE